MNNFDINDLKSLENTVKKYLGRMDDIFNNTVNNVTHYEYSTGDEFIQRGYYCPSLIVDKVYGNVNRGRLLKSKNPSRFSFKYGLNDKNQVITVENSHFKEVVMIDGNKEIDIRAWNSETSYVISVSEYDGEGRIITYRELSYITVLKEFQDYKHEAYEYDGDIVSVLETNVSSVCYRINKHTLTQSNGKWYPVETEELDAGLVDRGL